MVKELADQLPRLVVEPVDVPLGNVEQLTIPFRKVRYDRDRHEKVPTDIADLVLDMPLLVAGLGIAEAHREFVLAFEPPGLDHVGFTEVGLGLIGSTDEFEKSRHHSAVFLEPLFDLGFPGNQL